MTCLGNKWLYPKKTLCVVPVGDWGILVLVLSAIVLTVALGLITCVLSHYRPVAGEGAADGGTAADPHDAARTPTTAPVSTVLKPPECANPMLLLFLLDLKFRVGEPLR